MTSTQRNVLIVVVTAIILFIGVLFWPFLYSNIVYPVSLVIWLLLRIFVLSIDQQCIWGVLVISIGILILQWVTRQISFTTAEENHSVTNNTPKSIDYWRGYFFMLTFDDRECEVTKRELIHLLGLMYSSKQNVKADFHILDELKSGQITLPENIRNFLFPDKPKHQKRTLKSVLQTIWQAPQMWLYRSSGRKKEEFYRMVDEVLSYLESSLEMNNDSE